MSARSALLRSIVAVSLLSLVTLGPSVACNDKKRGALMLSMNTDMRAPKDVNAVSLTILAADVVKFNTIARVNPDGEISFPATIAIVEPDDPNATIRIRVIALQETAPRVLRDVRTTVPRDGRVALLPIPLTFVNDGSAKGVLPSDALPAKAVAATKSFAQASPATLGPRDFNPYEGAISSICGPDDTMTVVDGTCASSTIDPASLSDYDAALVGTQGVCFDVPTCFGTSDRKGLAPEVEVVEVDVPACRFPRDARPNLNLALATRNGSGECLGDKCLVPLDKDSAWTDDGAYIVLSKGVCKELAEGQQDSAKGSVLLRNASANAACTSKTIGRPVCQSVPSASGGGDGGGPAVAEVTPEQVLKSSLPTAIAVTDLGFYYAGPTGLYFQPAAAPSTPIRLAPGTQAADPWTSAQFEKTIAFGQSAPVAATGEVRGYVTVESPTLPGTLQTVLFTPLGKQVITAVAVTSSGNFWALSDRDTQGALYTSGGYTAGQAASVFFSDFALNNVAITSLGHLPAAGQLLVGVQSGEVQICPLGGNVCSPLTTGHGLPSVDSIGTDPAATSVSAFALKRDSVHYVQRPAADLELRKLIDEPGDALAGTQAGSGYLPRSVTLAGQCGFYASPKGIEFISIDGTKSGWLVDLQKSGLPAASLRTYQAKDGLYVYYALYADLDAAAGAGGGVWRARVPARCAK